MKTRYVLGFIFNSDYSEVLLIQKNRPDWQKGKLNGIGGHLEEGENARSAVSREVHEESSLLILSDNWSYVIDAEWENGEMSVFTVRYEKDMKDAKSMTDEVVGWFDLFQLPENVIPNLQWMIPLCKNVLTTETSIEKVILRYR